MDKIINPIKELLADSPEYIYLMIGFVFLILFIGVLLDKDWAISPGSTSQRSFYNNFGRKTFRVFTGIGYGLAVIAGFGVFFLYLYK